MKEFFDISTWSVLQWVLVVLVAGFIGQFGKSFAQFLMAKVKERKAKAIETENLPVPAAKADRDRESGKPSGEAVAVPEVRTETTMVGRADPDPVSLRREATVAVPHEIVNIPAAADKALPSSDAPSPSPLDKLDKKALKARQKMEKKAAKAAKKMLP